MRPALEPGLPLLWLAQGQRGAAQAAIRRAVGEPQPPHRRAAVLAACVEIMIDGSELQAARAAANELTAMTALSEARYLRALNAQATWKPSARRRRRGRRVERSAKHGSTGRISTRRGKPGECASCSE